MTSQMIGKNFHALEGRLYLPVGECRKNLRNYQVLVRNMEALRPFGNAGANGTYENFEGGKNRIRLEGKQ